ncbi:MAG: divalent-cation tolerance protein CutA [Thermoanaerobaculia bacterium]
MTATATEAVLVLTTLSEEHDPAPFARTLVEERLAACVNVVEPIRSFYVWEGKLSDDREQLFLIKTTRGRLDALRERLLEIHPYDTPEFVVLEMAGISEKYGAWLAAAVGSG